MSITLAEAETLALLERFGIHKPVTDERYLAHAQVDKGVAVGIEGRVDAELGSKIIELRVNGHSVFRMCPVTQLQASAMLDELHGMQSLLPRDATFAHMVTHLLIKCSKLYTDGGIDWCLLAPVYLDERDYRVGAARMMRTKPLHLKARLDPHAHDRKAVFDHRPR